LLEKDSERKAETSLCLVRKSEHRRVVVCALRVVLLMCLYIGA
jgi:hypothetical protein